MNALAKQKKILRLLRSTERSLIKVTTKKVDLKLRVEKHEDVKYFSCIFHSSEIKLIVDFDG